MSAPTASGSVVERLKTRLGGNLHKYFPESSGDPPRLELTAVSHRSYSNLYFFSLRNGGGRRDLAVKVFLPSSGGADAARLQYAALTSVWPTFRASSTVTIPRPLDYLPELCAIVTETVHGRSLQNLFKSMSVLAGRHALLLGLVEQSGQWLRKFHAATALPPGRLDVQDKLASLRCNLELLHGVGFAPDFCLELEQFLERMAAGLDSVELEMAAVHGDFTVDNVLFDGERIIAIDLGGRDQNAVYHDIATFLNSLSLIGLTWPVSRRLIERSRKFFLSGYFAGRDHRDDAVNFLRAAGLVSVALEILNRRKSEFVVRRWLMPYLHRLFIELMRGEAANRGGKVA